MIVSMIMAIDENNLIGNGNELPWNYPEDLLWFRNKTKGKICIVGRKTYTSLMQNKVAAHGRIFVVIGKGGEAASLTQALNIAQEILNMNKNRGSQEVVLIGGKRVYEEALIKGLVDVAYITKIPGIHEGDVYLQSGWENFLEVKETTQGNEGLEFLICSRLVL